MNIPLGNKHNITPPGKTKVQEDYLQKLTKFSPGNNVLYPAAANRDGFLWRDIYVSSTLLNRAI
jgi:hypothetical protein